ncbi:hypothetical protein CDAR_273211 [Caerostris darwini]|uniref:Uncharacterized protein n=1 Tax=Caerostris darwini TaxID=1538125 RepID=A0AAV4MHC7_9ARAC|nr:hypothetical protein CDAR_273211 [Caerostris darwini]
MNSKSSSGTNWRYTCTQNAESPANLGGGLPAKPPPVSRCECISDNEICLGRKHDYSSTQLRFVSFNTSARSRTSGRHIMPTLYE